ncbi:protein of unknown function [coiled-coil domain] [Legionella micdadei]|uniref:Uncharacterized protein n=2 Tax=Pseudomonadota TaxID=1224 RepID=A0A098GAA4_LEGMI|nr:hypothetical protein Lmic_0971 [Legionella micdadei]CEG59414.1 protein of unknown function [coiled-coil domain] [Legionella micdadei]SCX89212.1 hypothetical protein SAMN02982997_00284 [Legionella micdadei]
MKNSELKAMAAELGRHVKATTDFPDVLKLTEDLESLFRDLNDEDEIDAELRIPITAVLNQFWDWVIHNLPYEQWQGCSEIDPWLGFQRQLAKIPDKKAIKEAELIENSISADDMLLGDLQLRLEKFKERSPEQKRELGSDKKVTVPRLDTAELALEQLATESEKIDVLQQEILRVQKLQKEKLVKFGELIKTRLLTADYHHPILYQALKEEYESLGADVLSLDRLMPLLIVCGRKIGYAKKDEFDYPISHLPEKPLPQQIFNFREIVILLSSIFYLIFHHCTVDQLKILPFLIYFRLNTTDEERCSEQAILSFLSTRIVESQAFFKKQEDHFDAKAMRDLECVQAVQDLLPKSRGALLRAINEKRWLYAFIHQHQNSPTLPEDSLGATVELLEADFFTRSDQSYPSALNFAEEVNAQCFHITEQEKQIVGSAIHLFCLDRYIRQSKVELSEAPSPDPKQIERDKTTGTPEFHQRLTFFDSPEAQWMHAFLQQSRHRTPSEPNELLHYAARLCDIQFGTQEDKSQLIAQKYQANIKKQRSLLTPEEAKIVNSAFHSFCLKKYTQERLEDERERYSDLSLSKKTKCNAAHKKRCEILGIKAGKLGFFEYVALRQGGLKRLNDVFEQPENTKEARQSRF